jgi:predicted AAA+ superfamily ATPase
MKVLLAKLNALTVFRTVLETPAMQALTGILETGSAADYGRLVYALRSEGAATLSQYLWRQLCYTDAPFGRACAAGTADDWYRDAARRDLEVLSQAAQLDWADLLAHMARVPGQEAVVAGLPVLPRGEALDFDALVDSYCHNGVGLFAQGRAFRWEDGVLMAVRHPDPIDYADMIGYQWQREEVIRNTRALVQGKPANNVLLYGDSGTGKSATIKSLINMPEFYNLRIVEVSKADLGGITALSRLVGGHTQKFILYIDDLSFEQEDKGFSALKTALEGGLELRPDNVAIYATSNRRHMIRENFSDRQGDDVHAAETMQERTSLSERFGLRIPYMSLGKPEFLDMVCKLAAHDGLTFDEAALRKEASTWEIQHGGSTPRVARQFVDFKLGEAQ